MLFQRHFIMKFEERKIIFMFSMLNILEQLYPRKDLYIVFALTIC